MNKIKKELLKALLSMHGQKKICDCLNNIDQAFDILLREQKRETIEAINKEYKKAEKMEGYDIKKAIFAMEVLNKVKELIEKL